MTNEERDIITRFIQRVGGAPQAAGFGATGSVPATTPQPQLPPIDPDADRLLGDLFTRYPEARYRITQMAFAQEAALAEAHNRIQHMQWEMQQAQQQAQAQAQPQGPSPWGQQAQPQQQSRGFFGGLFGGGQQPHTAPGPQYAPPPSGQYAPPPQPQYPPGYQPGMFRSGSGFLGSALTTAAGVAGGMVVGNALMDLFSGPRGGYGGFGGGGFGGPGETVVNNYYGDAGQGALPQDNPWAGAGQDAGNADFANAPDAGNDPFGGGGADPGQWDQTSDPGMDQGMDQGGWDDAGSGGSDDDLV